MTIVHTLGQLVVEARKHEIRPGRFGGKDYYTLVFDKDGKMVELQTTTKEDFIRASAASPRREG